MPLNDNAVLKPTTAHYYLATVGTVLSIDDLLAPPAPWVEVGHTSIENLLSITSDGGDATSLGTLQNPNLRTSYSQRTETFAFTLMQWDAASLALYFGSDSATLSGDSAGFQSVPTTPTPTTKAFAVVFRDGVNALAFWAPKAEILRGDDLSMDDNESLAGLPLSVKPLQHLTNDFAYAITPLAAV